MIGIGLGLGLPMSAARAQSFDPASMFAGGYFGWVEPMIPGVTLFQDAAGTIPVTAPGQPVGLSKFTAGGQVGFAQATALNRPIYQVDAQGRGYLSHNGLNQWMVASAFAWGSDKATICAGVMRNAGASGRILFELSENLNTNAGSFLASAPEASTKSFGSTSRGSSISYALQSAYVSGSPGTGPDTAVITVTHDIAADLSTISRNGIAGVSATGDKGSGNFGTYPLYAGARTGTLLFFSGNRYPSVGINRRLTEAEMAKLETWVNARTGAY